MRRSAPSLVSLLFRLRRRNVSALILGLAMVVGWVLLAGSAGAVEGGVAALGRLEPADGVIQLSGPSRAAVVILEILVAEGDRVEKGQKVAVLDSYALNKAQVDRFRAELKKAELEMGRISKLASRSAASGAMRDTAELGVVIAQANLAAALAEFELSVVRAPVAARVLEIHAHAG